jgi:hypothetical protein
MNTAEEAKGMKTKNATNVKLRFRLRLTSARRSARQVRLRQTWDSLLCGFGGNAMSDPSDGRVERDRMFPRLRGCAGGEDD